MNLKTFSEKVARGLMPPAVAKLMAKVRYIQMGRVDFKKWWNEFKAENELPQDLVTMMDYFVSSPAFSKASAYWNYLNRMNIEQIASGGYDNFKQTVAKNYFTFVGATIDTPYAHNLLSKTDDSVPVSPKELLRKHDLFSLQDSLNYNLVTQLLFGHVKKTVRQELLENLEEPAEGNPPAIFFDGKRISQDILNSAIELNAISDGVDLKAVKSVIEVGAGSGRTSYAIMKKFPHIKYTIVDIPPALYISQRYLSSQMRDRKVFKFSPFTDYNEIKDEFEAATLRFITPDQLKLLPNKSADLFLAIDCLHEMPLETIEEYFNDADRVAKWIYFKCWCDTTIPFDEVRIKEHEYPVPKKWKQVYHRRCVVPSTFFEAVYKI